MTFPKSNSPGAMNLGAFAVVVLAGRNLRDFAGLSRTSPVARVAMVIFLVSLVGMPPLAATVAVDTSRRSRWRTWPSREQESADTADRRGHRERAGARDLADAAAAREVVPRGLSRRERPEPCSMSFRDLTKGEGV